MIIQRTTVFTWGHRIVKDYWMSDKEDMAALKQYLNEEHDEIGHEEWREVKYLSLDGVKKLVGQVKG